MRRLIVIMIVLIVARIMVEIMHDTGAVVFQQVGGMMMFATGMTIWDEIKVVKHDA